MTSAQTTFSTRSTANTSGSDDFRYAVDAHARWVFASAYRQLHDRQLAEDATQTVFLLLFRRPHLMNSPQRKQKLSGWLFNTLQYTVQNLRRSERRRVAREAKFPQAVPTPPDPAQHIDLADQLDAAVATLSSTDRAAILLRFYQDFSFEQIAQSLNISEPAAKKRVTRAITSLRRHFAKTGSPSLSDAALSIAALHGLSLAPATLTTTITTTAASATLPVTIAASLKGATTLMAITKLQSAALITIVLGILAIPTTLLILHANGPAPTPPVATAHNTPETYLSYYALAPNEPFKIVNAPAAFRIDMYTALQSPQNRPIDAPAASLFFDWNGGSPQNPLLVAQKQFPLAQAVIQLSALALNLKPDDIQLNAPIPNTLFTVPGDFVYDSTRPAEQTIPALEAAFRTQMKLNLKLSFASTPEDFYVLSGNWAYTPVPNEDPAHIPQFNGKTADSVIEIFGSPTYNPTLPKPAQGFTTDADGLATQISEWIQHPVVINAKPIPHLIGWRWNDPPERTAESERLAHDPAAVLNHITEQTGLTWKKESRPFRRLVIEKSNASAPASSPDDYFTYYSLAPGEVMKLVADVPPEAHSAFLTDIAPRRASAPQGKCLTIYWSSDQLHLWGAGDSIPLSDFFEAYIHFYSHTIDFNLSPVDRDILDSLKGDLIFRDDATSEQYCASLEPILSKALGHPITLKFHDVQQKAIVLRGTWHYTASQSHAHSRSPEMPVLEIYGTQLDKNLELGIIADGNPSSFAGHVGEWINEPILIEADGFPELVTAHINTDSANDPQSHSAPRILNHLVEQTGLTWSEETRPIRHLVIESSPAATAP